MKTIRAYSCTRDGARAGSDIGNGVGNLKPAGAVCFLLNETHALHTLRTFLRGQGEHAVLEPMSDLEASRLLGTDVDETPAGRKKPAA